MRILNGFYDFFKSNSRKDMTLETDIGCWKGSQNTCPGVYRGIRHGSVAFSAHGCLHILNLMTIHLVNFSKRVALFFVHVSSINILCPGGRRGRVGPAGRQPHAKRMPSLRPAAWPALARSRKLNRLSNPLASDDRHGLGRVVNPGTARPSHHA